MKYNSFFKHFKYGINFFLYLKSLKGSKCWNFPYFSHKPNFTHWSFTFVIVIVSCTVFFTLQNLCCKNFNTLIFSVHFLMTEIGKKIWYILKLDVSDLHYKSSHRIQHILFCSVLQEFEHIFCSFLMTQIDMQFRYVFKLHSYCLPFTVSF